MTAAAEPEPAPELGGQQRRRLRTQRRLLDAGIALIGAGATPEALTITQVVDAAEVGVGSFYSHYGDLPTYLEALAGEWLKRSYWAAIGDAMPRTDDPALTAGLVVWEMISDARSDPAWARFVVSMQHGATSDQPSRGAQTRRLVIESGIDTGQFHVPNPILAEWTVTAVTYGLMRQFVHGGFPADAELLCVVMVLQSLGMSPDDARAVAEEVADARS